MSDSLNKPDMSRVDYREGADVQEQHAIAAREKDEPISASHPVSLTLFFVCAVLLLTGGAFYGQMTGGFNFTQFTPSGYSQAPDPRAGVTKVEKAWFEEQLAIGSTIYKTCGGCHKSAGEGDPAQNIPPLAGSEWVTGSSERLALIIINGMKGPVEVDGKVWSGNNMAGQAASVPTPEKLAAVMNYIRHSFGNETDDWVSVEMAAEAMKISEQRGGGQTTAEELNSAHDKMLPGEPIDKQTGKPISGAEGSEAAPADPVDSEAEAA